ncbi:MAG: HTTM domain-containing protein [Rubripirellula sp.]
MNDSSTNAAAQTPEDLSPLGSLISASKSWATSIVTAWDRFWFTPRLPHMLAVLRIVTGLMLLYSHLVLASDLLSFVGKDAWINDVVARGLHDGAFGNSDWGRTYVWYLNNPLVIWLHHALTIGVSACFAIGLLTRFTAPIAWLLQLMLLHRLTGTLFGLDQIVTYSVMYLMLSPCGSWLSVDAWIRDRLGDRIESDRRLAWLFPTAAPSVAANIATRLLQLHLCIIYLFGGLAKARGTSWWDGTAMWYSAGNFEYQSLDLTWISKFPRLASSLTHLTLFWEVTYAALVWPRLTRPLVIATAIAVHGGIAIFMGMVTFGSMMIAANMIFVRPEFLLRLIGRPVREDVLETLDEEKVAGDDEEWDDAEIDTDDMAWDDDDLVLEVDQSSKSSIGLGSSIGVDYGSAVSGIGDSAIGADDSRNAEDTHASLEARAAKLDRTEKKLRAAAKKLKEKSQRVKGLEANFRERVSRLKEREAKIKKLVERRRKSKDDE